MPMNVCGVGSFCIQSRLLIYYPVCNSARRRTRIGKHMRIVCIILMSFGILATASAETTRYVNDYLVITLRAGMGDEYRILRTLPSGTKLEVVEEIEGHVKVRTEDGIEGWVRSQYLRETPVARIQLQQAQVEMERMSGQIESLKASESKATALSSKLEKENRDLTTLNAKLEKENKEMRVLAAKPMALEEENTLLKSKFTEAEGERLRLDSENVELQNSSSQKWFVAGAGALLFGIVLGLVLPRLSGRRKSGWA